MELENEKKDEKLVKKDRKNQWCGQSGLNGFKIFIGILVLIAIFSFGIMTGLQISKHRGTFMGTRHYNNQNSQNWPGGAKSVPSASAPIQN